MTQARRSAFASPTPAVTSAGVTPKSLQLKNGDGTIGPLATYLQGPDGNVIVPTQPILPLVSRNVTSPLAGYILRGVGFRGGSYVDTPGVTPLTAAAATELRGVHAPFFTRRVLPGAAVVGQLLRRDRRLGGHAADGHARRSTGRTPAHEHAPRVLRRRLPPLLQQQSRQPRRSPPRPRSAASRRPSTRRHSAHVPRQHRRRRRRRDPGGVGDLDDPAGGRPGGRSLAVARPRARSERSVAVDGRHDTGADRRPRQRQLHGAGGQRHRTRHARHQRRRLLPAGVDPRHAASRGGADDAHAQLVAPLVREIRRELRRDGHADLRQHAARRQARPDPSGISRSTRHHRCARPSDPEPSGRGFARHLSGHGHLRGGQWLRGSGGLARHHGQRDGDDAHASPGRRGHRQAPASPPSRPTRSGSPQRSATPARPLRRSRSARSS